MVFLILLSGGPCSGKQTSTTVQPKVGDTFSCGGHTYLLTQLPNPQSDTYEYIDQGVTPPGTPPPPPTPSPTPAPPPTQPPPTQPPPGAPPNQPPTGGGTVPPMATDYTLVGSYETVQSLSPTTAIDVIYCTIQTKPSGVVAARPVDKVFFSAGTSEPILAGFAQAIETVMGDPHVIAGVGDQELDAAGLLVDNVVFTVEYTDPVHAPNGATALATVPVTFLNFSDAESAFPNQSSVTAIIDGVYANLKAAAGG